MPETSENPSFPDFPERPEYASEPRDAFVSRPSVRQLFGRFHWRPIPDCPGRYVLDPLKLDLGIEALVGSSVEVRRFEDVNARDAVLVVVLEDGGVISYERTNGTILHTLNTPSGLRRKLSELAIRVDFPLPGATGMPPEAL
jgi:hypothetical protein